MKWCLILPILFSTGCAELAATAIIDARDLHEHARTYLGDIYAMRQETRRQCREIINRHVDNLVAQGQTAEALEFLASYYPPLTSAAAVKAAIEDDAGFFDRAVGCERYDDKNTASVGADDSLVSSDSLRERQEPTILADRPSRSPVGRGRAGGRLR